MFLCYYLSAGHSGMNCLRSLESWNRGFNSTESMHVWVGLFCVCVVLCVGSGLATGWSSPKGFYRLFIGFRNWKNCQGSQGLYSHRYINLSVALKSSLDSLDGGSARRQAAMYTQSNTNRDKRTQTFHALSGNRTDDPSVQVREDSSCLRPRDHCYRILCYYSSKINDITVNRGWCSVFWLEVNRKILIGKCNNSGHQEFGEKNNALSRNMVWSWWNCLGILSGCPISR
jgi:hypothetical protein